MSTLDDLKAAMGAEFFDRSRPSTVPSRVNWQRVCTCGHLGRYHSPTVGGQYELPVPGKLVMRGDTYTALIVFDGCRGALTSPNVERETTVTEPAAKTVTTTLLPSCPCREFRPIVNVDRPNRFFNQRMPTDRKDPTRHPFWVGVRAFSTHIGKRAPAQLNPDWATEEFTRRFQWIDGARVCGISKCRQVDDVLPVFVTGDRSELRCAKHR